MAGMASVVRVSVSYTHLHRHPESGRHVDKERCGKIDIDELHMKLLGKEFILQVQSLPYPAQQVIENEVVMARSQMCCNQLF